MFSQVFFFFLLTNEPLSVCDAPEFSFSPPAAAAAAAADAVVHYGIVVLLLLQTHELFRRDFIDNIGLVSSERSAQFAPVGSSIVYSAFLFWKKTYFLFVLADFLFLNLLVLFFVLCVDDCSTSQMGWRLGLQAATGLLLSAFFLGTFYRSASLYHPQRRAILHLKTQRKKVRVFIFIFYFSFSFSF
jgi:hypothetical protein